MEALQQQGTHAKTHMFCPKSGYLLDLNATQGAAICSVSGFKRDLSGEQQPLHEMRMT